MLLLALFKQLECSFFSNLSVWAQLEYGKINILFLVEEYKNTPVSSSQKKLKIKKEKNILTISKFLRII